MKILSIGFGFVGKAYSIYLKENGHNVKVITNGDKTEIDAKKYGFERPETGEEFDATVIAVPTPTKGFEFDDSILFHAVENVHENFGCANFVIKSTVSVGTTKKLSEKHPKSEFYFYPEFLEAKNPIGGVFNQKIKIFGNANWTDKKKIFIKDLFRLGDAEFTNLETAETVKYAHNLWLASNISFWNSMMRTADKNVDFGIVLKEVHKSDYFGKHPWAIGNAFGGECIPKDLKAYIGSIKEESPFKKFLQAVNEVNGDIEKQTGKHKD